jgi:hypothetical protein
VTRPVAAALLLLAAFGLHFGLTVPARRRGDESRAEFARLRAEREGLRAEAARLQRRAASARAPLGDAEAARALRLSFLGAVEGLPLRGIRVGAEASRQGQVAARGRMAAEGGQGDLLRAAGRLAEASSGVLLENVRLAHSPGDDLRLEIEAYTLRTPTSAPPEPAPAAEPPGVSRR